MADREKVMKALECCSQGAKEPYTPTIRYCAECPYLKSEIPCTRALARDALELLKEQEPRVLTLEEVEDALDTVVWVDRPLFDNTSNEYALIDAYSRKTQIVELRYPFCDKDYRERADFVDKDESCEKWKGKHDGFDRKVCGD